MKELVRKELLDDNDYYLIIHNGIVTEHSSKIDSLDFDQNIELKVIHLIDKDTEININIASRLEVKLDEIFYCVENNPTIKINIKLGKGSKLDYLSFKKTCNDTTIRTIVNTYLDTDSYINNKNLSIFSSDANITQNVYLDQSKSKIDMKNVFINSTGKTQDFTTNIHHNNEYTISNILLIEIYGYIYR